MDPKNPNFWPAVGRLAFVVLAVVMLSGCVIVPGGGYHYHPGYWR